MTSRGRGRSRPASASAIAIPGRAGNAPLDPLDPFAPQGVVFFAVPLAGPSMAPQQDQFMDAAEQCTGEPQQCAEEDGDGRESPASSISSSGYGSCPSNDSSVWGHRTVVEDEDDHWRERVVFASSVYPSMAIDPTFNYWSPISEDEPLLEELARLPAAATHRMRSNWPSSPAKDLDCESDIMHLLTEEIFGSSARQGREQSPAASRYSGRGSGAVFPDGDPTLQNVANAPFMPDDAERASIVQRSNELHWGQFASWAPMPTDEEAERLAAVAERQQEEMRRQAMVKKMQKLLKYRKCRRN